LFPSNKTADDVALVEAIPLTLENDRDASTLEGSAQGEGGELRLGLGVHAPSHVGVHGEIEVLEEELSIAEILRHFGCFDSELFI